MPRNPTHILSVLLSPIISINIFLNIFIPSSNLTISSNLPTFSRENMPSLSQLALCEASKQKAVDSMTSTNIETQIPATDVKANLPLENGWLAYGNAFGSPFYRLKDGICSLQGLISGGTWGRLGTLPADALMKYDETACAGR